MKKIVLLILYGVSNIFLSAQTNNYQLFPNISGSSKSPSFFIIPVLFKTNSLLFEIYNDSTSNIYLSDYSVQKDSFTTPVMLTNNNFLNINPVGVWTDNEKLVFFQTNLSGNWGIGCTEYLNGKWNDIKIIADSTGADGYPSIIRYYGYSSKFSPGIVYKKNNSIYMFTKNDSVETTKILISGLDSIKYSSPTAMYTYSYYSNGTGEEIRTAAMLTDNFQNHKIIENVKSLSTGVDTTYIVDEGNVNNPQFLFRNGILLYEKTENGKTSLYTYDYADNVKNKLILNDTLDGSFSNLQTENTSRVYVGKKSKLSLVDYYPYIYNFQNKGNTYIGINRGNDTLIYSRVQDSKPAIEFITYSQTNEINYAVWEDSINGNIKLLGFKLTVPIPSGVNTDNLPSNFALNQNYPNPFNPSTTISYEIPKSGSVQLKVYDVLGREIETLVNEEQSAGMHSIIFNSKQANKELSSGIYLYRLKFGSNVLNKKMIFLK